MHRYILAESAHACQESSETEFESNYHSDLHQGNFSHFAADYEILIKERGVVVNRIDVRKTQAKEMIEWVNSAFEDTPIWEIRERASIQRSLTNGRSIFHNQESCDQADVFTEIAANLNRQFGFTEMESKS